MRWRLDPNLLTAGGNPKEWRTLSADVFILGAIRVGGPDDSEMPRRVMAAGLNRSEARETLEFVLRRVDPQWYWDPGSRTSAGA